MRGNGGGKAQEACDGMLYPIAIDADSGQFYLGMHELYRCGVYVLVFLLSLDDLMIQLPKSTYALCHSVCTL